MFCESRTINNVIAYVNEYYINSKGLFNAQSNECLLEISGQQELYPFGKDHLISREIVYGDSAIININDLTIVINNYRIEAQNYPYFSFYEVDDKPQEGIYDFEKKKILFEATSWLGRSIIDKYIFRDFKKKIACRKIDSNSILWEFPLSSLGKGKDYNTDEEFNYEVEQFVGIYNNILWVYIERGGFIGLDIQTGKLKHRILGIPKGNLLGKVDSYVDSEEFYIFYRAKFILDEKKGSDIVVLDISEISVLSDYFVLVSAENDRQLEALKVAVEDAVQLDNRKAEGESSSGWILLDYKDVIVHIFDKDTRSFYNLEKIWSDAKRVEC